MQKRFEISVIILLSIYVIFCALNIGSSWDEPVEITRGHERLKYLFSFGSFENYWGNQVDQYMPGFYSTLASLITKMLPEKYEIEVWHLTNAFFSVLTIFGIYRISSNLFNKKLGKIVFLLCFLNPIFFGHMAMNSKDTIIAFAHVWTTYVFLRYLQKQNSINNCYNYIFLAGLSIGLGTGVRIPFITTLLPILFFAIADIFFLKKIVNKNFSFKKFVIHLFAVLFLAYIIAISFWPHAHVNIFIEPFKLFITQIKSDVFGVPWMLVNGNLYDTSQLPKTYIFTNFFYKSPEFILLAYLIFIYFIISNKNFYLSQFNFFSEKIFLIILILIFPIIYFIFLPYRVYDGLRLFLNMIPYFCIIPGLAIYYLIYNFRYLVSKIFSGIIFIFFIYYLYIFISLTPYHYTYLNIFIGNFSKAHNKFENDYWAISIRELVKKISNEKKLTLNNEKIKIAFCGAPHDIIKRELKKLKNFRFEQKDLYDEDFDYVIMTNRIFTDRDDYTGENAGTCFEKIPGKDITTVKRNNLILSTLRKKF